MARQERPCLADPSFDNPLDKSLDDPNRLETDSRSWSRPPSAAAESRRDLDLRIPHIKLRNFDRLSRNPNTERHFHDASAAPKSELDEDGPMLLYLKM